VGCGNGVEMAMPSAALPDSLRANEVGTAAALPLRYQPCHSLVQLRFQITKGSRTPELLGTAVSSKFTRSRMFERARGQVS
jgi:hypothetical protein